MTPRNYENRCRGSSLDQAADGRATREFNEVLVDVINGASVALMISIGHRTGLFKVLGTLSPSTSVEIALQAGLSERYVREWLATMVVGKIIAFDEEKALYHLPPAATPWLTPTGGVVNFAVATQIFSMLARTEDRVVEEFRMGGGLRYDEYPSFHRLMAELSEQNTVAALIPHIFPLVDGIISKLESGINILDIGCGAGRAILSLANCFPKSRFVGLDLCEEAFASSDGESVRRGLRNLSFKTGDAAGFSPGEKFDLIMAFEAIHDQPDPMEAIRNIYNLLFEDGVFLMQEVDSGKSLEDNQAKPLAPFLYTISCMHCIPVSLGQGGSGIGSMWGEETAREFVAAAGFRECKAYRLPHDLVNLYYVIKK